MIETQTKTDRFRAFIDREVSISKEFGFMEEWELYEHLKGFIPKSGLEHETAIKIITEVAGL